MLRTKAACALGLALTMFAGCGPAPSVDQSDISGIMPRLEFRMERVNDHTPVTATDYHDKTVLLYFGYTHCPDECPTTLAELERTLSLMGPRGRNVRVLFVTVDPARDTIPVLRTYVGSFGANIDGLRGSANAIASLARRYRVLYEPTPASGSQSYSVMHSDNVFVFDGRGNARLVLTSTKHPARLAYELENLGA